MTAPRILEDVGPIGEFYRAKDWSTSPLGPPSTWPPSLRGYVDMILRIPSGAIIFWGPDQIQLYNLRYSDIMGPRHPRYLGAPYRECWPDTYPTINPMMQRVMNDGEVVEVDNALIPVTRYGFTEETYFSFSFVPLRGDGEAIEGFIQLIGETTREVIAERRLATLRALAPRVKGSGGALRDATAAFEANAKDVPFSAVLLFDPSGDLLLAARTGLTEPPPALLEVARDVVATGEARRIEVGPDFAAGGALGPWPEPAAAAMVLPLRRSETEGALGAVVLGISSRLSFDDTYRAFFEGAARELASNLAFERENQEKARLHQELQKRADALTELDRAKTAFFSNVSHEFRTPLTLMLGPIEDALADRDDPLSGAQRARLTLAEKSGARLFKLVNTLLDFSRIEAGRARATFAPTDLAQLTADLASAFRSLVERAGLTLIVDCPPLAEPIWVDPSMWEKIVLNLLSNAFKFTLEGTLSVRLRLLDGQRVELEVRDTGSGIPAEEMPRLFERFHRIEGAKGRSFEGSGIGLALVQELVRLLGGEVRATSELGVGTAFFVTVPTGVAHVPPDRRAEPSGHRIGVSATSFLREAEEWASTKGAVDGLGAAPVEVARGEAQTSEDRPRILLADDNADMRDYVARLLGARYRVETVANGLAAVEAARSAPPDLVVTDVMMPGLDGFGVLRALREDPATRLVPVLLLSARAGEEARVEGMEAGADDYLVKPFAARELLARVGARLEIAQLRTRMNAELERLVLDRTAQLREANQELESFSYSVSHDLRAPLRHILGFSQLMEKSSEGLLDAKSAGYLKTIAGAARRGGQLVDDLLAFSRMGRAALRPSRVDLGRAVADVRVELAPDEQGRNVEWNIQMLPEVSADPALLRLVMKNLLANALKYTQPRENAVIEVGGEERATDVEIWVKDNGVGFDMRYVDKLFGVFQRLHTNEEFEGTGIGLALVRRVVLRHGGTTRAEGKLGEGAKFSFTLPKPSARP